MTGTAPQIVSASVTGTTLTLTMDEPIWSATAPDAGNPSTDDFSLEGDTPPTVQSVSGLPTTAAAADDSFTLTLSSAPIAASRHTHFNYYQDFDDATKIPRDRAGQKTCRLCGAGYDC